MKIFYIYHQIFNMDQLVEKCVSECIANIISSSKFKKIIEKYSIPSVDTIRRNPKYWRDVISKMKQNYKQVMSEIEKQRDEEKRLEIMKIYGCRDFVQKRAPLFFEYSSLGYKEYCSVSNRCHDALEEPSLFMFPCTDESICSECLDDLEKTSDTWINIILNFYDNYKDITDEYKTIVSKLKSKSNDYIKKYIATLITNNKWKQDDSCVCTVTDCHNVSQVRFIGSSVGLCEKHNQQPISKQITSQILWYYRDCFDDKYIIDNNYFNALNLKYKFVYNFDDVKQAVPKLQFGDCALIEEKGECTPVRINTVQHDGFWYNPWFDTKAIGSRKSSGWIYFTRYKIVKL
jgi:hypothetical protein